MIINWLTFFKNERFQPLYLRHSQLKKTDEWLEDQPPLESSS